MKKKLLLTKIASVVILTLSVTSCARFEKRAQAEGDFDYVNSTLTNHYNAGNFTQDEIRSVFQIQPLTEQQKAFGLLAENVDIRPPIQLMPVIEGVQLDPEEINTKVWFNAFSHDDKMEQKVWDLTIKYLAANNAEKVKADRQKLVIYTGPVIQTRSYGRNDIVEQASYMLEFSKAEDGRSVSMMIDVKNHQLLNNDFKVKEILQARTKHNIEVNFINDLLRFAYQEKESEKKVANNNVNKPLAITLGFDDNHQTAWIIDTEFVDAWDKLPNLFETMSFEMVQKDKNLGYFLLEFVEQDKAYWNKNNLNPITLASGEYFAQLGELSSGQTSLVWLDSDKKVLSDQEVTDLYLSITNKLRQVILNNEEKTNSL